MAVQQWWWMCRSTDKCLPVDLGRTAREQRWMRKERVEALGSEGVRRKTLVVITTDSYITAQMLREKERERKTSLAAGPLLLLV